MSDSVFTKMIKGEIPCYKVYEDPKTVVIIPLHPVAKAHVLVIPKTQVDRFTDLSDDDYVATMATVKKVAKHIEAVTGSRAGLKIEGLDVPHTHVHVIAFDTPAEFKEAPDETLPPDEAKQKLLYDQLKMDSDNV